MRAIRTVFLLVTVLFLADVASAQQFSGPSTGSVSSGDTVSTGDFSAEQQAAAFSRAKEKRGVGKQPVTQVPDPQHHKTSATGAAGTNHQKPNAFAAAPRDEANLMTNFEGIADAGLVIPPDPHMAAGPDHLMAVVNQAFAIFDKSGNTLFQIDADSWFDDVQLNASPFDPQIVYDHDAGRWVMIWIGGNLTTEAWILVSVSDDSNPLGTWYNWSLPGHFDGSTSTNNMADYPKIGIDENAIYVSSNQFDMTFGTFQYAKIRIVEKSQLYANTAGAVSYTDFWDLRDPQTSTVAVITVVPAVDFFDSGTPDNTEFLISDSRFVTGTYMTLWKIVDPVGTPVLSGVNVAVTSSTAPPNATQLGGGSPRLDVGGRRVRNAVYRDGDIWTAHSVAGATDTANTANARYVRIDTTTDTAVEDVAYGAVGDFLYYPAIQVDAQLNMVMTYSRSNPSMYVEAAFTSRGNSDPGLAANTTLKAGEDNYVKTFGGSRNRWGDYLGIALDPDTGSIWMLSQYAATDVGGVNGDRWGSWFGEVTFDDTAPTITSTPTTTGTVGVAYSYDANNTVEASGTAPILFTLDNGPAGFTVSPAGLVTWTPAAGQTGPQQVTIRAANTVGFDTQSFTINVSAAPALAMRINSGGPDNTTTGGKLFVADKPYTPSDFGFVGGVNVNFTGAVAGTLDDPLYQTMRGNPGSFAYDFDVPPGTYSVTFYFMEPWWTTAGARVFDVSMEGSVELDNLDIFAGAGANYTAYTRTVQVTVTDGTLDIDFAAVVGIPIVSAIEVVATAPPTPQPDITVTPTALDFGQVIENQTADLTVNIANDGTQTLNVTSITSSNGVFTVVSPATPFNVTAGSNTNVTIRFSPTTTGAQAGNLTINSNDPDEGAVVVTLDGEGIEEPPPPPTAFRINCGGGNFTTGGGDLFVADKAYTAGDFGFIGGITATFGGSVSGTTDDALYQAMRGNRGSFAYDFDVPNGTYDVTLYFTEPWFSSAGSRVFDVSMEGSVEVDDLDIFAASGGLYNAYTRTVTVTVNDGTLDIDFTPVVGIPIISAIEVVKQ